MTHLEETQTLFNAMTNLFSIYFHIHLTIQLYLSACEQSNITSLFVNTTFFHDCILLRIVVQGLCTCEGSPHGPCILGCWLFFFVEEGKYKKCQTVLVVSGK